MYSTGTVPDNKEKKIKKIKKKKNDPWLNKLFNKSEEFLKGEGGLISINILGKMCSRFFFFREEAS